MTEEEVVVGWLEASFAVTRSRRRIVLRLDGEETVSARAGGACRVAVYNRKDLETVTVETVEEDRCCGCATVEVRGLIVGRVRVLRVLEEVALEFVCASRELRQGDAVVSTCFGDEHLSAIVVDDTIRAMPVVAYDETVDKVQGPVIWRCRKRVHRNNLILENQSRKKKVGPSLKVRVRQLLPLSSLTTLASALRLRSFLGRHVPSENKLLDSIVQRFDSFFLDPENDHDNTLPAPSRRRQTPEYHHHDF